MRDAYETFKGEGLKTGAERSLQLLGGVAVGRFMLEHYAGGLHGRIEDPRLAVTVAGIEFDNPLIVGAGWDKKGRAIHGLYHLGFAGVEVGTVPPLGQSGEPQPRLWTIDKHHRVGLNRMGFNSPGKNVIEDNLAAAWPLPCPIGLNVGRNKITPNERAADDHDKVIRQLGDFANYIVLGISSPNTPGLRELQRKEPLTELILRAKDAQPLSLQRRLPVFVKIDPDRTEQELHDIIEAALEAGAAGIVAANTSQREEFKAAYGERWAREAGGLSGAHKPYREASTRTVRRIYEEAGDQLAIIGAGGVDGPWTALEKIEAGATAVQVVTAMRPSFGRVAATTSRGLSDYLERNGVGSIQELVGVATKRGPVCAGR